MQIAHHDAEEHENKAEAKRNGGKDRDDPVDRGRHTCPSEDEQPDACRQRLQAKAYSRKSDGADDYHLQPFLRRQPTSLLVELGRVLLVAEPHERYSDESADSDADEGKSTNPRGPAPVQLEHQRERGELHEEDRVNDCHAVNGQYRPMSRSGDVLDCCEEHDRLREQQDPRDLELSAKQSGQLRWCLEILPDTVLLARGFRKALCSSSEQDDAVRLREEDETDDREDSNKSSGKASCPAPAG